MTALTVPLGEVVAFKGGGTPSRDNESYWGGAIPWATVKDFNSGAALRATLESITPEGLKNSASNVVPAGTVVIPTRMALGKAAITEVDIAINQDLKAVIPDARVDRRYLLHYFIANRARIEGMGKGATVKGITLDQLRALPIPLPPLAEQRRIAALLDKADALRAKRREAIAKLDQLLQAVFVEMFGDPATNEKHWPVKALGQILSSAEVFTDGDWVESKDQDPEGAVRLIQLADVGEGFYVDKSRRYLTKETALRLRCTFLQPGDVLVARMPDPLGRACIFPGDKRESVTVVDVCVIRPGRSGSHPQWLAACINSPGVRSQIEKMATGTTRSRISRGNLAKVQMIDPPKALQDEFARAVVRIESTRKRLVESRSSMEMLSEALKQQAFAGVL